MLTFRGREVADVIAFIVRTTEPTDPEAYKNYPQQEADEERMRAAFGRFELPDRLS